MDDIYLSKYLGSVAVVKDFKPERMFNDHPIFVWVKEHFGLLRDQIEFEIVEELNSLYHNVLHILSKKSIENISTLRQYCLL